MGARAATAPTDDLTWAEAHHALVPLLRADNRVNWYYIAQEYFLLTAALVAAGGAFYAWKRDELSTMAFVPLAMCLMFVIAALQHRLSGLGHEASHYSLFRNRWANELVSDFLLMFPMLAMTQQFRATHLDHHRFVNDPERDPDVQRLNQPFPLHWPMAKASFWLRFVVGALWPPYLLGYLYGQAKNANVSTGAKMNNVYSPRAGRLMRLGYWVVLLTAVSVTGTRPIFLLFWLLPLVTFYPFLMQLREIAHHSNAPDDGDLTNSRLFRVHPLWSACVFPYGQAFHITHHLFGMLPHYRMEEAHAILMRCPSYREQIVICHGYFFRRPGTVGPTVLDVLAAPAMVQRV